MHDADAIDQLFGRLEFGFAVQEDVRWIEADTQVRARQVRSARDNRRSSG